MAAGLPTASVSQARGDAFSADRIRALGKPSEREDPDLYTLFISSAEVPATSREEIIQARISEEVAFNLSNEYGALFDQTNDGPAGRILNLAGGMSSVSQALSRQIWKGSSHGEFSLELMLIANKDPVKDVRDKITRLFELSSPTAQRPAVQKQKDPGYFQRHSEQATETLSKVVSGVSKAVGISNGALLYSPRKVNLDIPNVLSLTDMYIQDVNFSQTMKLMRSPSEPGKSYPMMAQGSITVVPQFMILSEDIKHIFPR